MYARTTALLASVLPLLAAPAGAGELARVRVEAPDAGALAARLEAEGWDVLEGSVGEGALELVTTESELAELRRRGLAPVVLELGRPFAEIQAEDGVPGGYPDLARVLDQLAAAEAAYPELARLVDLTAEYGTPPTEEGRPLYALKISDAVDQDEDEPAVLVVSAHHSRELVTPVIALHAVAELLSGYGGDPEITALVDSNEIWIAPVWNPDGYEHVFQADNLWRKNRRPFPEGVGVDLNRNYDLGWETACSGSSSPSSSTYKGPAPESEAETRTMVAFAEDRRFAKVIDFHSSGREVLWGYLCPSHPAEGFLQSEAVDLSWACGYGGDERKPSADGEHYEWELGLLARHAFLVETATQFQPPYAEAVAEAQQVFGGIRWLLERPVPAWGHVVDACTGEPVEARITVQGLAFGNGEENWSGGPYGRWHAFLPPGTWTLEIGAVGYAPETRTVTVGAATSEEIEVALQAVVEVTLASPPVLGTTFVVEVSAPADAGLGYAGGPSLSGTAPGIPLGGCTLPLNPDALTFLALSGAPPFAGFAGVLDAAGSATATIALPSDPVLAGTALDLAFATFDPASGALLHPSDAVHAVLTP